MKPFWLIALLALTACATDPSFWEHRENKVEYKTNSYSFTPSSGNATLTESDQYGLSHLFSLAKPLAVSRVEIQTGLPEESAVITELKRFIGENDIPLRVIAVVPSDPGAITVSMNYTIAVAPACPDWSKGEGANYPNIPYSNFSCANATNIGMQIADPGDLLRGHGDVTPDGDHTAMQVQRYRAGEITSDAKKESASSGGN